MTSQTVGFDPCSPTRISLSERNLCWAMTALFAAYPLTFWQRSAIPGVLAALVLLTAYCWRKQFAMATSLGLMSSIAVLMYSYVLGIAPAAFGAGLLVVWLLSLQFSWLRPSLDWLVRGKLDRHLLLLSLCITLLAASALIAWFVWTKPNLEDLYRAFHLREFPVYLLVLGAAIFSTFNAAAEELMYRGFMTHALNLTMPWPAALLVQASAFGMLHVNGFPRGWVGIGLATIYGLMMGGIRQRAGGMLAPWLAHIAADMTIVGILIAAMH